MTGTLGLAALVAEAKSKGYTGVKTHGGVVPLDKWTPYGIVHQRIDFASWFILGDDIFENTCAPPAGQYYGVWKLVR